eukprot:5412157-Amphidinium_carterae.1
MQAVVLQHRLAGPAQLRGLGQEPSRENIIKSRRCQHGLTERHPQLNPLQRSLLNELNNAAEIGNWKDAQSIYAGLKAKDELPTDMQIRRVYFNTVLKAFAKVGNFEGASTWFARGSEDGISANSKGLGKLIDAAAKASCVEEIHNLREQGPSQSLEVQSMLMAAYAKLGRAEDAAKTLTMMQTQSLHPDVTAYNTLINAHSKAKQPRAALDVLRSMPHAAVTPDAVTYRTVLDTLAKAGRVEESTSLLKEMASITVRPDVRAMNAVINAHAEAAKGNPDMLQGALAIVQDMRVRRLQPQKQTYGCVIKAACNARSREVAMDLLLNMEERHGIAADVTHYDAVMRSCVADSQLQEAKNVLQHMQKHGIQPDEFVYSTAIRACAEDRDPELATQYFQQMQHEHGLQPNVVIYTCVIQAYTRSGRTHAALTWLYHMLDAEIEVNAFPFRIVTSSCLQSTPADFEVVEAVLRLMSDHGVPLSMEMYGELQRHALFGR